MIDREKTIREKGYDPDELSAHSAKRIWAICDNCGEGRLIRNDSYRDLCMICSHNTEEYLKEASIRVSNEKRPAWGKHPTEETRAKLRTATKGKNKGMFGKHHTDESKQMMSTSLSGENHPLYGKHLSDETCEKIRVANTGRKFSNKHRTNLRIAHKGLQSGKNHPNWKGGISGERSRYYRSDKYKQWRKNVFERDGFVCQECGDFTGGNLQAHHILPYRDWKEPQYSLNLMNGITLCEDCHKETFRREYGFFNKYFDIANGVGI